MKILRNTAYNLLGTVIPILVAIVTVPIYLHVIGSAKFGLLSIAFLILGYFGIFDLGLGRAVAHRVAGTKDNQESSHNGIVGTAIICNLALGFFGGILLWIFTYLYFSYSLDAEPFLKEQMIKAIPALVISVPITALTGVLSGALEGRGKFVSVNAATAFSAVLFHIFPLGIALWGVEELHWLIAAACLTRIVGVTILYGLCVKEFGFISRIIWSEARQLFRFGGWVALSSLIGPLMIITDRFVIGALIGPAAVAHYTIPFEIAARTSTIPQALGRAMFPQISAQSDVSSVQKLGYQASLVLASVITPLTIIGIFAMKAFLDLWLGSYAAESVIIGQIILVAFWVNAMSYVPLTVIVAGGRPKVVAATHCIELIPYLATLYILTKNFGIEGAALAFLLRCVVDYFVLGQFSGLLRRVFLPHAMFAALISGAYLIAAYFEPGIGYAIMLVLVFVILTALTILPFGGRQILLNSANFIRGKKNGI